MFRLFSKHHILAQVALLSLVSSSLVAQEYYYDDDFCCPSACNRIYIGGFGGGIYSNSTKMSQTGTAFFLEALGGPLAVDARGHTRSTSSGFGGVQLGYEWRECPWQLGCSDWSITPAVELEAFFYSHTKKGDLINELALNRLDEHDFHNKFPMRVGVYLVNGVLSLNSCCLWHFTPYVGGGIGAARIHIHGADSLQIAPLEAGVNHFNSNRGDYSWAFAAQAKVGLRYNICDWIHLFGEYRYLFVDTTNYVLGSTDFPGHAPTSTWNIRVHDITYNAFAFGVQFDL